MGQAYVLNEKKNNEESTLRDFKERFMNILI